jgi:hypothetical protein
VCINEKAKKAISFHEGIHGFRKQRGCQTALFEAKMDIQAREDARLTYHQIFLDLSKAFDMVDQERLKMVIAVAVAACLFNAEPTKLFLHPKGYQDRHH